MPQHPFLGASAPETVGSVSPFGTARRNGDRSGTPRCWAPNSLPAYRSAEYGREIEQKIGVDPPNVVRRDTGTADVPKAGRRSRESRADPDAGHLRLAKTDRENSVWATGEVVDLRRRERRDQTGLDSLACPLHWSDRGSRLASHALVGQDPLPESYSSADARLLSL